ncbi:hypothetical protein BDM02DRAFT_3167980 [Thelephora ganbajun]|uniref:Uncharacterized protein n=1 Tax=Thelephora ganbajun TaxID=370292 RepID=A0ACB6ZFW9_THEGA|nr:hypothetical protein BDM02DRAFT_3167980 [Thelephora ganbajun]
MSLDDPFSEIVDLRTLAKSVEDAPEVVSWLNSILDEGVPGLGVDGTSTAPIDLTSLDRRVSSILSSVEIVAEETSSQLERIIDDISRGAPRLAYDLHFTKESAISLQASLRKLQHASTSAESPETKAALERLHYLDNVKRGMEAARDVLREAESWSSLESEVSSLLSEQNYEKAAETLSEAAKSMVVFQNTPEYESRRSLMVSLQNQLEASLSSALVAAINSQDVAVCKNYFSIFKNIQREAEFRNYYYGSRRGTLVTTWQKARLRDADAEVTQDNVSLQTFAAFLPSFFATFLTLLETERSSAPSIFPDPPATLSSLISSTLSSLQPTFSQRLSSVASSHGPYTLTEIISSYTAAIEFANSTENIMEKVSYTASPHLLHANSEDSTTSDAPPKLSRRRSRLSISRRMSRASMSMSYPPNTYYTLGDQEWQQELFEPFLDYQVDYGSLEQKLLVERLEQITAENTAPGRPKDGSRWLRERSVDAFSLADQSLSRCMVFTHGYGFVGLVQALDSVFASILQTYNGHISTDNRLLSMDSSALSGGDDLSDMDYTTQDWSRIQMYLRLLGAAHGFNDRLGTFEDKMRTALVQASENIRMSQSDAFSPAKSLPGVPKGALQILAQSTLNSVELQNLLKLLESDPQQQLLGVTPSPRIPHTIPSQPLNVLTGTRGAISDFAKSCQVSLQKTILSPLHKHLASYASLPVWSSSKPVPSKLSGGTGALTEIQVPVFSISPSDTVQRVAEGLLNLPRLFEVYADDDALAFSIETLPFVDEDLLRSVTEQFHSEGRPHSPSVSSTPGIHHSRRSPSIALKTPPVALAIPTYTAPTVLSPEAVSAAWLSSLALSLLTHLTGSVLPKIKTLTPTGAAQLSSDLGYLSNVVQALNVRSADLEKWKDFSDLSDEDVRRQAKYKEVTSGDQIFLIVAKMRGWV